MCARTLKGRTGREEEGWMSGVGILEDSGGLRGKSFGVDSSNDRSKPELEG